MNFEPGHKTGPQPLALGSVSLQKQVTGFVFFIIFLEIKKRYQDY
jgi:hypothetical protein